MPELLQEYVDSGTQQLRVDRDAGIIRGVKLLGLHSRNGRRYREHALLQAVELYEGAKVNINHPKGHPLSPRDYQDRLGAMRGVAFRAGEGLFGDLHFNPNHALSEQLVWDAERAPQNVGLSHNVLARTTKNGEDTVVEAIVKVQSIDLVADPATTSGLFEHATAGSESTPVKGTLPSDSLTFESLTLDQLKQFRPDLLGQVQGFLEAQLSELQSRLDEALAREEVAGRRERILSLLQEHGLPLPSNEGNGDSHLVSSQFLESLLRVSDDSDIRRLIEERAQLVHAAGRWSTPSPLSSKRRPRSRVQLADFSGALPAQDCSAKEFAASLRR